MSEYFVGTTGSNSQTTFEALTTSEVLDDLGLNTGDAPTFSGLFLDGSGSTIFSVDGSNGRLFGVTDEVTGTVFSVNDADNYTEVSEASVAEKIRTMRASYGRWLAVDKYFDSLVENGELLISHNVTNEDMSVYVTNPS